MLALQIALFGFGLGFHLRLQLQFFHQHVVVQLALRHIRLGAGNQGIGGADGGLKLQDGGQIGGGVELIKQRGALLFELGDALIRLAGLLSQRL